MVTEGSSLKYKNLINYAGNIPNRGLFNIRGCTVGIIVVELKQLVQGLKFVIRWTSMTLWWIIPLYSLPYVLILTAEHIWYSRGRCHRTSCNDTMH